MTRELNTRLATRLLCPRVSIVTICGQGRGEERAHVAVNLAAEATLLGKRVLLVDLDPRSFATQQVFHERSTDEPNLQSALVRGGLIDENVRKLRIDVRSWRHWRHSRDLFVVTGAPDLDGQLREQAASGLAAAIDSVRNRYDLVVFDAPALSDRIVMNALGISDRVIFVIRAGAAIEQEIRTCVQQAVARGAPPGKLLHLVVGSEVNQRLSGTVRESLHHLVETSKREGRPIGRLLNTEIGHDVGLISAQGLEVRRRSDWLDFAAEVLADCGA
jgi:cellulose biosynthesis protein BcsQ